MSDVFGEYSTYYDVLYEEKDYEGECDYLESLWDKYSDIPVQSIVDLGCGTGGHSILLAQRGYDVVGIDRSESMLELAMKKARTKGLKAGFRVGDIADFHEKKTFDCAIAMFAVIGYLTSNEQLLLAFKNIRNHLNGRGLFIFDVWYGPAVLCQKPGQRLKATGVDDNRIYRFASPKVDEVNNTVRVDYLLLKSGVVEEMREAHMVRYFFIPELKLIAGACGFEFVKALAFPSRNDPPSALSWNMTCILRARE